MLVPKLIQIYFERGTIMYSESMPIHGMYDICLAGETSSMQC